MVELCEHDDIYNSNVYEINNVKKKSNYLDTDTGEFIDKEEIVNVEFRICPNCDCMIFKDEKVVE